MRSAGEYTPHPCTGEIADLKGELDQDYPPLCTRKVLAPQERDRCERKSLELRSTGIMEIGLKSVSSHRDEIQTEVLVEYICTQP